MKNWSKLLLLIFLALEGHAHMAETKSIQISNPGIQWTTGLTWEKVKAKAKAENKYIFVDCFTTWCSPCKKMDKYVYVNDSVSDFMNSHFISIRVQMDKTKNDDEEIKAWYSSADIINNQYCVISYPTFLFFSPDGNIVHRAGSYNSPAEFIEIAKKSLNSKEQFYSLMKLYEQGEKTYEAIPYLIKTVEKQNNTTVKLQLEDDYLSYLATLKMEQLFTKEKIEIIASSIRGTNTRNFRLFYPNGKKVNAVMGQSGFARRIADSAICRQFINPVLGKLTKEQEPDWKQLFHTIKKYFGASCAERNIIWNKAKWCDRCGNILCFTKYFVELVKINGLDTSSISGDGWLNFVAYNYIFKSKSNYDDKVYTEQVNAAIKWMEGVVQRASRYEGEWQCMTMDTYAMLLYKKGRKVDALVWEKKALDLATELKLFEDKEEFKLKITKMNNNEPTWLMK